MKRPDGKPDLVWIQYQNINFGSNVKTAVTHTMNNTNLHININRIKKQFYVIACKRSEVLDLLDESRIHFLQSSLNDNLLSGYIILFYAMNKDIPDENWTIQDIIKLRSCKKSIIGTATTENFGSMGEYWSFGNKAEYRINNQSSVGLYRNKPTTSNKRKIKIEERANEMEKKIANFVKKSMHNLSKIFQNIDALLSPFMLVAYDMQEQYGNINLQNVQSMESGTPHVAACNRAYTSLFHSEEDVSYTFIGVPNQSFYTGNYYFCIKINEKTVTLQLKENIQFIFNAYLMTHRQICTNTMQRDHSDFFNIFAFSQQKLFHYIRKSFQRLQNLNH